MWMCWCSCAPWCAWQPQHWTVGSCSTAGREWQSSCANLEGSIEGGGGRMSWKSWTHKEVELHCTRCAHWEGMLKIQHTCMHALNEYCTYVSGGDNKQVQVCTVTTPSRAGSFISLTIRSASLSTSSTISLVSLQSCSWGRGENSHCKTKNAITAYYTCTCTYMYMCSV